jgi:hypothetical protein
MEAEKKARELVEKFDETLTYLESKEKAKQCAIIAVDEILSLYWTDIKGFVYWNDVKQEIEKL